MTARQSYDQHFCQKSTTTAQFFVAGTILIALALVLSLIVFLTGFKNATASTTSYAYSPAAAEEGKTENHASHVAQGSFSPLDGVSAFLDTSTTLLAGLAVIFIVAGQALGINAFVDTQLPSGIDSTPIVGGLSGVTQSAWYWGPGAIIWPSAAWLSALIGVAIAASGCGVRGR